jgi:hypothetical protein
MTSSQPVITPSALNFTPDNLKCYTYGPQITNTTSDKLLLEFNTQSEYIKGIMQLCGSIVAATVAAGNISNWHIDFNDSVIARFKTETQEEDSPTTLSIPLIVPPFTNVKVYSIDNDTNGQVSAYFTGKAYGMTETGFQ